MMWTFTGGSVTDMEKADRSSNNFVKTKHGFEVKKKKLVLENRIKLCTIVDRIDTDFPT